MSWIIPFTRGTNSASSNAPLPSVSSLSNAALISYSLGFLSLGAPLVKSSIIFLTSGNSNLPDLSVSSYFITSMATCFSLASSLTRAYKANLGLVSTIFKDL